MYLKSLELQGFKSFPDKIVLTFDKGITAVVGPNGSGKSNIGDAVRWVLGEQSTKTLRGNKMEDVIFSGTVTRKPVGFAAVTLNIDNSERTLDVEDDEVRVTRKLFRSGESEYLINGKQVRLKDINELFMDTGLGRDGYSIIGQGRIAEIVSAKSGDRRDIFEEAAGISKFRYKKEEAQRKLNAAQENLVRLNDIVSELDGRVEPLRIQSEKAQKFLVLSERKKSLDVSFFVYRLNEIKKDMEELEEKILICQAHSDNINKSIETEEEKINKGYDEVRKISALTELLRNKIREAEQMSANYQADAAVSENDIMHMENAVESIIKKQEEDKNSAGAVESKIAEKLDLIAEVKRQEKELAQLIERTQKEFEKLENESEYSDKSFASVENRLNELYIKQSEYRFILQNGEKTADETQKRLSDNADEIEIVQNELDNYKKELAEVTGGLDKINIRYQECENRLSGYEKLYQAKKLKYDDEKTAIEHSGLSLKEKQQRVRLLNELENSMEGFSVSVKEIMKLSKKSAVLGIKGTVAQLIKVKSEYALAIETALGGALQNIITDDENTAKRCIRLLKEKNAGRATFLPMTSVKGRKLDETGLNNTDGFVGIASELVECDLEYNGIISYLLGRIVIAEDMDSGTSIAKKYGYKFRIVTLDGQVINAGGSFTGGSAQRSSGVLTRKNNIAQLENDITNISADIQYKEKKLEKYKSEYEKLLNSVEHEKEESTQLNNDKIRFLSEKSRLELAVSKTEERLLKLESDLQEIRDKDKLFKSEMENAEKELFRIQNDISSLEKSISGHQEKREELKNKRQNLSLKLPEMKIKQAELAKDKETAERDIDSLKLSANDAAFRFAQSEHEIKELKNKIDEKKNNIDKLKGMIEKILSDIEKNGAEIKELLAKREGKEKEITLIRNGLKDINSSREKLMQEKIRLDERKASMQKDSDSIVLQMFEEYELTRTEAEKLAGEITDIISVKKELSELKNEIKALGNVNVAAIEEYKEVSERHRFLSAQLADVQQSKSELEKLISDLTKEMAEIFAESFISINENFKRVFAELFGGGKAELVLTEPDNVLESGIEINVAPPGKVIKNLISLSGGEQAFVAVAIYFAILEVRPAPFCILDEIDAALDDVNVMKYAQYLQKFTDTTQFILITHRRGSMEAANILYGVTMQESGISKLLKLEQVDFS